MTDFDVYGKIKSETLRDKEFDNPVSKYYGVEVKEDKISENDFRNLEVIESYPLDDYSYEDENGEMVHLVEVYILQNTQTGKYIYFVDEPKLRTNSIVSENLNELPVDNIDFDREQLFDEMEWYNRVRSNFDSLISSINKEDFESYQINRVTSQDLGDDIEEVLDDIESNELALYLLWNGAVDTIYNNIVRGLDEDVNIIPNHEDVRYQTIPQGTRMKIRYYLQREYVEYGKISPLLSDPYVEEISANAPNEPLQIFNSKYSQNMPTTIAFDQEEMLDTINMLANQAGEQLNDSQPQADGALPDGSRVQLSLGEVADNKPNFTIRVFDEVPLTPIDLLNYDTFSVDQMIWMWMAIEHGYNGIIAGGTASGKTTTLNSTTTFVPNGNKIVTIEDTRELSLHSDNVINSVTRESTHSSDSRDVDMMDLIKAALRQRPDYLIVGEVRGEEATEMFQAMQSGHISYSTFHADNLSEVKSRLTGLGVGVQDLGALDFVLNQTEVQGGRRVVNELREVNEVTEDGELRNDLVSAFNYETRGFEQVDWDSSHVIDDIKTRNNWSDEELREEIDRRRELLEYMAENMPRGDETETERLRQRSKNITQILKLYSDKPELVMEMKEKGLLLVGEFNVALQMEQAMNNADNLYNDIIHNTASNAHEHAQHLKQNIKTNHNDK